MALDPLTGRDAAILALEAGFWKTIGAKEQAIRDELGMSPMRYYQRLNQLVDTEGALQSNAVLVNRLRRLRGKRAR